MTTKEAVVAWQVADRVANRRRAHADRRHLVLKQHPCYPEPREGAPAHQRHSWAVLEDEAENASAAAHEADHRRAEAWSAIAEAALAEFGT